MGDHGVKPTCGPAGRSTVPSPTAFDANVDQSDNGAQHTDVDDPEDRRQDVRDRATTAVKPKYGCDALGRGVK